MTLSLTQSRNGTWVDEEVKHLKFPPSMESASEVIEALADSQAIVFVGANGAGKSRMAAWIDRNNEATLYIRARRDVLMPNAYSVSPEDAEYMSVLAGQKLNIKDSGQAKQFRYGATKDTFADNDFSHVINMLGSRHATSALKFAESYDPKSPPLGRPRSDLDAAVKIWSDVLPHLLIDATKAPELRVRRKTDSEAWFAPKEMSDGEKAIFYLVSKCLIAPPHSTILVDEPEMYVHRSIRTRLWNNIEKNRSDCSFIYFTHDLNFVRSRTFRSIYSVKSYSPSPLEKWDYAEYTPDPSENEVLQISVWGSRQPTIIVEGTCSSLDTRLLSLAYPGVAIEPGGSCDQVLSTVGALRAKKHFHHQEVYGLIDPDFRTETELRRLRGKGINSLKFREVENVLVCEEVIREFLKKFEYSSEDANRMIEAFTAPLRQRFLAMCNERASDFAKRDILNLVETNLAKGSLDDPKLEILSRDRLRTVLEDQKSRIFQVCQNGTWDELLRFFSVRKDNFGSVIAHELRLKDYQTYQDAIVRIMKVEQDNNSGLRRAITRNLPQISFS